MPWRRHAYIIGSETVTNGFSAAVDLWHIWDHFPFFPEEAELNFHVFVISSFPLCSLNTSSQQVSGGQRQSPYHVHCLTTAHPLHWPCHAAPCPLSALTPQRSPQQQHHKCCQRNTMSFIITALHCSSDTRHHRDLLFLTDSCLFIWRTYPQEIRCEKVFVNFFCFCFFPSLSKLNYKANVNVRQR